MRNESNELSNVFVFAIAGPCGGKTTGQTRLCTFFENMGWKVVKDPSNSNFAKVSFVKGKKKKKEGNLVLLPFFPPD